METGFVKPETPFTEEKKSSFRKNAAELQGKIATIIGSGKDAQNAIVYLTLKWAFISGVIVSILVITNNWIFRSNEKVPDFIGDIKITWEIIIPVITLALGYAFGKSEK